MVPLPLGAWLVILEHQGPAAAVGGAGMDFPPTGEKGQRPSHRGIGASTGSPRLSTPYSPAWAGQTKGLPLPETSHTSVEAAEM